MRDNKRRIFFPAGLIVACRCIHIGGNFSASQIVADRVDIYLAWNIAANCALINQTERILIRALDCTGVYILKDSLFHGDRPSLHLLCVDFLPTKPGGQ